LAATFTPDGTTLATSRRGILSRETLNPRSGVVQLWDTLTGQEKATLKDPQATFSLAFAPDGRMLVTGGGARAAEGRKVTGHIKVWDTATFPQRAVFPDYHEVSSVTFLPDGRTLLIDEPSRVCLRDAVTGQAGRTFVGDGAWMRSFAADGNTLALPGERGLRIETTDVKVWSVATGKEGATIKGDDDIEAILVTPDGKSLILATQTYKTNPLPNGGMATRGVVFKSVTLWDVSSGRQRAVLEGHSGHVRHLASTADSRLVATGGDDPTVKLWDAKSGAGRGDLKHDGALRFLAFTPDSRTLISVSQGQVEQGKSPPAPALWLWDVEARQVRSRIPLEDPEMADLRNITISADGKMLALAGLSFVNRGGPSPRQPAGKVPGAIQLWDLAAGRKRATFKDYDGTSLPLAFSPDGRLLALTHGKELKLRRVSTGEEVASFRDPIGFYGPTFAPDGKALAAVTGRPGGRSLVVLWDVPELDKKPQR
jgi:WD40 repeat protein